jgi:hypothetical protein
MNKIPLGGKNYKINNNNLIIINNFKLLLYEIQLHNYGFNEASQLTNKNFELVWGVLCNVQVCDMLVLIHFFTKLFYNVLEEHSQTCVNSHLWKTANLPSTASLSPAKSKLIAMIEKPLKSCNLCSTATILESKG